MFKINRPLLRLAATIHAELAAKCSRDRPIDMPSCSWDRCVELVRQSRRADLRGWQLAAEALRRDLGYTILTLQAELNALVPQLPRTTTPKTMARVGDIYADLVALQQDFREVNHDVRGRWLSVTTEPITLQGVYLGPFEIRLDWSHIGNDEAYRVIANDPHPPESRENVTHPHVMDERLCEGDSRHAIRQAFNQGRLLDFVTLVANGLRSYNPDSPFVALEIWYGGTCSDCGAVVDEDDCYTCRKCHETICESCEVTCSGCDEFCCSQCITGCEACDDNYCRGCLTPCKQCRAHVCSSCLEEDERCSNCHEKERREQNQITDKTTIDAAIQPHGVGQAPVFA
jgi:hypothetical protein